LRLRTDITSEKIYPITDQETWLYKATTELLPPTSVKEKDQNREVANTPFR